MATPIPTFTMLTTAQEFREVVNQRFQNEIRSGTTYNQKDLDRFESEHDYVAMFIQHGQTGKTFDEEKALRCFHDAMVWRKQNNIYDISFDEFPKAYLERHAIYYKNFDLHKHRILHYVVRAFNKGEFDNEIVKRYMSCHFEEHIRKYPEQRIVILFDMSDTGLRHLDYDLIKFVINCLLHYYPGILAYMLVYKLPFILQAAWTLIKTWLPTETQNSVKFVDEKTITNYIALDQLSKAMGGTASDEN